MVAASSENHRLRRLRVRLLPPNEGEPSALIITGGHLLKPRSSQMLAHHAYCLDRAAHARADAACATLENVRERSLRSEEAWMVMASRAADHEELRAKTVAHKATDRANATAAIFA
jgi:hypothetical protein